MGPFFRSTTASLFFCFLPFSDEHFIDQINAAFKLERSKVL